MSSLQEIQEKIKRDSASMKNKGNSSDERFWKPQRGKEGIAQATIRFLPEVEGDSEYPWAEYFTYFFQNPSNNRYYIQRSRFSIQKPDPCAEFYFKYRNSENAVKKEVADKIRAMKKHVANIYIISDSFNPSNNGKVFLYEFGNEIKKKIDSVIQPEFEDDECFNPFDLDTGADFRLVLANESSGKAFPSYSRSKFKNPSKFKCEDIDEVLRGRYPLSEFEGPDSVRPYEELVEKFEYMLGFEEEMFDGKRFDDKEGE